MFNLILSAHSTTVNIPFNRYDRILVFGRNLGKLDTIQETNVHAKVINDLFSYH